MGVSTLKLEHGVLKLPTFLPDATRGVVRSVDAHDLAQCGIQALQMNVFHLMQHPGSSTIQALGGLHKMAAWQRPIVTDSGGFQAYSLIRQNPRYGSLTEQGIIVRPSGSGRKFTLTPEKSIQLQMRYGADVIICLDDCTHADAPLDQQRASVTRTIQWAKRCKETFQRLKEQKRASGKQHPLLFAVIQGGGSFELRKRCALELLEIGFDGFGYGGWPLDNAGTLLTDVIAYTRELVPREFPMHALGIGHPANIVTCARIGYELFDSTLPTRDARHGRLYTFAVDPSSPLDADSFSYLYVWDDKHIKANAPISPYCDCFCCSNYSLGYLHHLFKIQDGLAARLATIHNLRFMTQLMERLRTKHSG